MNERIQNAYAELTTAINKVAGCSMLSWRTNPDLQKLVNEMQDKAFEMDRAMEDIDE
jgi:hypothetical protein